MFWRLNLAISKIDNRKFNKMIDSFDCTRETDMADRGGVMKAIGVSCSALLRCLGSFLNDSPSAGQPLP